MFLDIVFHVLNTQDISKLVKHCRKTVNVTIITTVLFSLHGTGKDGMYHCKQQIVSEAYKCVFVFWNCIFSNIVSEAYKCDWSKWSWSKKCYWSRGINLASHCLPLFLSQIHNQRYCHGNIFDPPVWFYHRYLKFRVQCRFRFDYHYIYLTELVHIG